MSDYRDKYFRSSKQSRTTKLFVCLYSRQPQISDSVVQLLNGDRYSLQGFNNVEDLEKFINLNNERLDCLILVLDRDSSITKRLWQAKILLPAVILEMEQRSLTQLDTLIDASIPFCNLATRNLYHQAELHLYPTQLEEISSYINLAITRFIRLSADFPVDDRTNQGIPQEVRQSLTMQQRRLTEKIQERLGYLGVCYKRDRAAFYPNLSPEDQQQLEQKLSSCYRQIALAYFSDDSPVNQLIDEFVDLAFFADISTSQVLEIHMELIDDFAQQLKIEGRNEDILIDYRLPLIDVTAHLCEMYRRSIAKKDLPWELLLGVE